MANSTVTTQRVENTKKFAKPSVVRNMEKNKSNPSNLEIQEILVAKPNPTNTDSWRAVLVDSFCQAGKTKKCFEILTDKIQKNTNSENTLVLFITQANSTTSANQTIQRAKTSPEMNTVIPPANIFRSANVPSASEPDCLNNINIDENYMIVDFWNSRNMNNMLNFVRDNKDNFQSIIIVIDESDQGQLKGLKERMSFIRKIEKSAPDSIVKVIFITATVANLSKSILQVAKANLLKFRKGIVSEIINNAVVEHQFATPHSTYVGASWFKDTEDVWNRLIFPPKGAEMTNEQYSKVKETKVMKVVKALSDETKELTLFVTSTRLNDHRSLAQRLFNCGYNVTVQLNGNNNKNFNVNYLDESGDISSWDIPFSQIDSKADKGDLEMFRNSERKRVNSGIMLQEDYTMSHVLQAALFMMTDEEARIKQNISSVEFNKLNAISNAIDNLDKSIRRPDDYPTKPRVALIAGHMAGRGITIQNPSIDFTCTSFCFTDTKDAIQRGATNTQRFGRACGSLMDVFARPGRQPILVSTQGIMGAALANETALREKAELITNGSLISLKDFVTNDEWHQIMKKTKDDMKDTDKKIRKNKDPNEELIDGVSPTELIRYFNSKTLLIGKMIRYLYTVDKPITFDEFKNGIGYTGSDDRFESNLKNGCGKNAVYGKIWNYVDNIIEINKNIKYLIK
jgi:hypothetical protein